VDMDIHGYVDIRHMIGCPMDISMDIFT